LIIATLPATGEADGDRYARERRLGPSQKANRALDPILSLTTIKISVKSAGLIKRSMTSLPTLSAQWPSRLIRAEVAAPTDP
jgi:hypothetical protein